IGAAIVASSLLADFRGTDGFFAHGQTYGGHPPSCAVALENIRILEDEALPARAEALGPRLIDGLRRLSESHPMMGPVRGKGLLVGVEMVKDSATGEDFSDKRAAGTALRLALRDAGLIGICIHPGNVLL